MVDELARGLGQARVPGGGEAFVLRVRDNSDVPFRVPCDDLLEDFPALVGRGVIDKDEFHVLQGLAQQRFGAALDERGDLEEGGDDGDFHRAKITKPT